MNDVQRLIDRQLGFQCRLEYDSALRRLAVLGSESYYALSVAEGSRVPDLSDQDPPIFACRFAEAAGYEHILALANEDGRVAIQDTSKPEVGWLEGFQCHNNAVFDLAWRPHHMNFVTVSGDHSACLWDTTEGSPKRVVVFSHHTRSVKSAVFQPGVANVLATGARDGHLLVWDVRASNHPAVVLKPDNCLLNCHSSFTPKTPGSHGKRPRLDTPRAASVTGLVFQDDFTLLSCGECDGNIKVWDLRKNYNIYKREPLPKHSIPYCGSSTRNGYSNLIVDSARVRLYASCMDSVIYCFNISTYNPLPEQRYVGHENSSFYIKTCLSPDGKYIVSGSSDKNAYIWSVRRARPVVRLAGHRAEVTGVAWGRHPNAPIATCSDDARHKLWRIYPQLDVQEEEELRGRAEVLPLDEPVTLPPWGVRTPASLKRRASDRDAAAGAGASKRRDLSARRTKRCLASLMGTVKEEDIPNKRAKHDSFELLTGTKRAQHTECVSPPKKLCLPTTSDQPLLPAGIKRKCTGDEACSPRKQRCHSPVGVPVPGASQSHTTPNRKYEKRSCKKLSPRSPKPKVSSPNKASSVRTTIAVESGSVSRALWTDDLPDFVRTGEAPHLRLMSPQKPRNVTPDWLTLLRRSRAAPTGPVPPQAPSAPAPAPTPAPTPAPALVSKRRVSNTDKTPKAKKTKTLLKYFTITEKE